MDSRGEQPGLLALRVVGQCLEAVDPELQTMRTTWGQLLASASVPGGTSALAARLNDVQHKLQGVRYHRDNYLRHEDRLVGQFLTSHSPPAGAEFESEEPELLFELEGFLYHTKSTLDMCAQLLRDCGCRSMGDSFGDHGERVIRQLQQPPKHFVSEAAELIALIEAGQQAWLDEVISLRDQVAHSGMLKGLACFVQRPYLGGGRAELIYPTMPSGERVRRFLERVEASLRGFVSRFNVLALHAILVATR